jgi:putative protease
MSEMEIGIVSHYFDKVGVAAIELTAGELSVGDTVRMKGHTTDLTTTVASMQIEHESVEKARKGEAIGIRVAERVRPHDKVYKVVE